MTRHAKTQRIIEAAYQVLAQERPMTVRQVYYQLVSGQVIENSRGAYNAVSNALVDARREGIIPWEWIEDRLRRPRGVQMWQDARAFVDRLETAYRRDVWTTQPRLIEMWLEKDALSGIFEDILRQYGVTLNVGRGYDGWSSIHNAALRFGDGAGVIVLYFGDFDPSGEDMVRSLGDRLAALGCVPHIIKASLTLDDIERYNLPPNPTKTTDSRAAAHMARYGEASSVELDALPVSVLRDRVVREIERRMDLRALAAVRKLETEDRERIRAALGWV